MKPWLLLVIPTTLLLAACGVSETAATAATAATLKAKEAENAKQTLERVEANLEAAQALAKKKREETIEATY
jgi:uncharacterized lipoprotein YajG